MSGRLRELPSYRRLPFRVTGGRGPWLQTDRGPVLDLYGGHCVNTLGLGDPGVGAALARQWEELSFVSNALEHGGRATLLAALEPSLPPGAWQVFATNSGAEANENLLKAAVAATGRPAVAVFDGAFHGRTAGVACLSSRAGAVTPRSPWGVRRLPFGEAAAVAELDEEVACVLLEPIQSLAGVREAPRDFLEALREACDRSGAWLLFDEVQTGNGRLGASWAAQALGVVPDAFATAKGVAGGLPLGLSFFREPAASAFDPGLLGSTFGGAPLALAAAAEVARRVHRPAFLEAVRSLSARLQELLAGLPGVRALRGRGLLLGVELEPPLRAPVLRDALLEAGVLAGTTWDPAVLRLMPPLDLPGEALEPLERAWTAAVSALSSAPPAPIR